MHLKLKKLYNCSFHHYLRQWEKEWEEEAHLIYPPYAFLLQLDLSWKLWHRNTPALSFYTCKQYKNKCIFSGCPALFNPKTRPLGDL